MIANILRADPPPTLGMGSIGQLSTFSEPGHIKLKGITKCSNMVANILPTDLPSPHDPKGWGQKVKIQLI